MKYKKGDSGYLNHQLIIEIFKTLIMFAITIAILLLGISQTGDRMNLLTVVAAVGSLPACKALVGVIVRLPYRSISKESADEITGKTEYITVAFDMLITSEQKIMPIDCVAISGNTVCGYASNKKTDIAHASKHIKNILIQNGYRDVTVKIFDGYTAFLTRAEGMNSIAAIDKPDSKRHEEGIRAIILNISM